ncbi:MAG: aminotransferase class V-fold PLP-dependent enzyme [Kofleriaceae bacterium]|nr:aminotransferase class V-fold PLP-dependent enzyme [Kofleriaceae bacterium]
MTSIAAYLDPAHAPAERPPRTIMGSATRELHDSVDANAPYLHPERRTIQRDLGHSRNVVAWQEAKAAFIVTGDGAWSELPHLYARYGTPGTAELIAELRRLERASCAFVTDCGMQAVALVADVSIAAGTHAIAMRQVYNKTRSFFEATAKRVGAAVTLVDDGDHAALAAALRPETRFVFAETFTNPLGRAQDVPALVELVHRVPGARLVIDSTIATPWGIRTPLLDQGVDVVTGSMTKGIGGQDAAMGGYIATNHAEVGNQIMDLIAMRGGILDDDRARRVVAHLPAAKEKHARRCATAAKVAAFLASHPRVERVFHPSRPDHPDAAVIARDYVRTGSLLAFRVKDADEATHGRLADALVSCGVLRYALSFDGLVTKVNHHRTVSEYFTPPEVVARLGIDRLIRLGIGLEEPDDLIACLNWTLHNG